MAGSSVFSMNIFEITHWIDRKPTPISRRGVRQWWVKPRMSPHYIRSDVAASSIIAGSDFVQTSFWIWPGFFAQKLMRAVAARRRGARTRREFQRMNDHLLKDIGLSPREIWIMREDFSSRG
jgi:uncharacterized protein YjiS (DUF1127 family)